MEMLSFNSSQILIKMDENFSGITISGGGELVKEYSTFCIIFATIKQVQPTEKSLSSDEKKAVVSAISSCKTLSMPVIFHGVE